MLFLADCNHLVHLFWHMAKTKQTNETGDPDAVPMVADVLDWLLNRLDNLRSFMLRKQPDIRFLAVFDSPSRPKRCAILPEYKQGRTRPDGITEAVRDAKEAVSHSDEWELWVSPEGWEADDLIASLAYQTDERVVIHSPDKDLNQCLEPARVSIMKRSAMMPVGTRNGIDLGINELDAEWYTAADYLTEFGFRIDQWVDYQCMVGDSADNLIGAVGVGPKKAKEILLADAFPLDCDHLLNKRQLLEWADFLERLTALREVFTMRNDLNTERANYE